MQSFDFLKIGPDRINPIADFMTNHAILLVGRPLPNFISGHVTHNICTNYPLTCRWISFCNRMPIMLIGSKVEPGRSRVLPSHLKMQR